MSLVDELLSQHVDPERAPAVRAFAHAYLRRLDRASEEAEASGELLHEVLGAFALAAGRDGAPAAVRAFNPTLAEHGYQPRGTVLETNTEDLPFLVDSVSELLRARDLGIVRVQHPIIGTDRDADGTITRVLHPVGAPATESVMHFELDRHLAPEELADLEDDVRSVLGDVRRVTHDFAAMRALTEAATQAAREAAPTVPADEVDEVVAFLEWLVRESFIFLGACELGVPGSGLGVLSGEADPGPREEHGELLEVRESQIVATVHRRARMAEVVVAGRYRIVGLFATRAYAEPASETPLLHRKLRRILAAEDLIEGSHDYKAAVSLFDSFPKDELFSAPAADLRGAVVTLLGLHGDTIALLGRRHPDGSGASLIAALPRDRYQPALLERLEALVRARFGPSDVTLQPVLDESERMRVHIGVRALDGPLPDVPFRELQTELLELARTWDDRTRELLVERHGEERGRILAKRWLPRLPDSYKASVAPAGGTADVETFERLFTSGQAFAVGLGEEAGPGRVLSRVGLYRLGGKVELSRAMPLLEHLGLRVVEERPTRLLGGQGEMWVQDFGVLGPGDRPLDLEECSERVADTIAAVWRGDAESDSLNRLVVTAGLRWPQIAILRAYRKYRQRIGSRFTEGYQNDVIAAHPELTAQMLELFERRFDPAHPRDEAAEQALHDEIRAGLDAIPLLDHDRVLRNQLGLFDATVRTNAYRQGRRSLAFKLRSAEVPAIPQPPPLFEIYVYSPEVEGIHLRSGRVARGGIRWSDRMDYRTEVFGLMRAQMTKNAVIVPEGAKGGFYLKRPPEDPAELRAEVERQYVTYISGLLDLTDNRVDGRVVHPQGVRVLDDDDSYLVVAADKGTAALSDTANRLAGRYGFWLGDAFASGGSNGYDHKRLGITARGAWESLKRHFRELDLDPGVDEFTVVGIGDMSGDVFGNGMLLSDRIRLVGAYDHRHVFLDPTPDAAATFAERRRLFDTPGTTWEDFDRAVISEGGGVWSRAAKSIPLSPQVRAALAVADEQLPPSDLIRAILRAPVDVLWNGGIGTVVKASTETDADALDRAGDAIRVDAAALRCRVVAEGGNLGLTQRARIEFARRGGLVNADFIDNSAGVDCSDHEVNLKILLDLAVRRGELTGEERDALLVEVTDEVARHVLFDSFLQAQILSLEVVGSAGRMFAYEDLMAALEDEGLLDRAVEALPEPEEMTERRRAGQGMVRPELAVLVAYAKRSLTGALLDSGLCEDPAVEEDLRAYFPQAVTERLGHLLAEHPLRRELVATLAANDVVDSLGPTFVSRLVVEQGAEPAAVVRAFRIAREVTGASERWTAIERLGGTISRAAQGELLDGVDWLVEATARWELAHARGAAIGPAVSRAADGYARLAAALPELVSEEERARREEVIERVRGEGVPEALARAHAYQRALVHAPDIIEVAEATGRPAEAVGRAFFLLGDALQLGWLESRIDELPTGTRTQRWALHAARDDVLRARRVLAEQALAESRGAPPDEAVQRFLAARPEDCARLQRFSRRLTAEDATDLAGVTLAIRKVRALVE